MIEESGEAALSLRACARTLGVDIAAAYRHFRKKDDLIAAVAADGFWSLGCEMNAALDTLGEEREDARAYFLACGRAYVRFGLEHKHLYRLMFGGRCTVSEIVAMRKKSEREEGLGPLDLLSDALDRLCKAGVVSSASRERAEFFAWSSMHGLASLLIEGRGGIEPSQYDEVITRNCQMVIDGL